jgi:MFS family permease
MFAAAGLAGANWIHAAFWLPEPPALARGPSDSARPIGALRVPLVRRLCATNFVFSLAVTQLETMFAFFMGDRFGYGAREVAVLLIAMAVLMGAIQGGGMKALAARWSERWLATVGSLLLTAGFLALPLAPSVALLLVPLALCAVGRAILQPALMSMVSLAAQARERGSVMGTFQASASLARVLGPIAAGWLYDRQLSAPFFLAGALLIAVAAQVRGLLRDPALVPPRSSAVRTSTFPCSRPSTRCSTRWPPRCCSAGGPSCGGAASMPTAAPCWRPSPPPPCSSCSMSPTRPCAASRARASMPKGPRVSPISRSSSRTWSSRWRCHRSRSR